MAKEQKTLDKSDQTLRVILVLIGAWILATWSKTFLEKIYCVLKFYLENKTFGQSPYCELLPGFYSGTLLTAFITAVWFVILLKAIDLIKKRMQ